ncbi:hypothetical protein [Kitasatospora aureofaciens]|uniref:hypothetical protein n=1 Tax=Kitasatospora aureofaciens TaxID=1894 RepID=UPI0033C23149
MTTPAFPRRTPIQQAAMTEAVGNRLGRLPHGLSGRTLDSLLGKGYAYVGDQAGRPYRAARTRGYTGFPAYFLTRRAYQALGVQLTYARCPQCAGELAAVPGDARMYRCAGECRQTITAEDLQLQPGEYVELRHWRLVILYQEPRPTGQPGTDAGRCDQCGTPILWDGSGRRVHDERGEYWCPFSRREAGRNPEGTSAVHVLSTEPAAAERPANVEHQEAEQPAAAEDEPAAAEPVLYCDPATILELRQLAAAVELAGATYHPDGTPVIRLFDAEGWDRSQEYQDDCPCCGARESGVTAGMVITTTDPQPLQRVRWSDGTITDWEPRYLRVERPAIPTQAAPWLRATIGPARPAFPRQRS